MVLLRDTPSLAAVVAGAAGASRRRSSSRARRKVPRMARRSLESLRTYHRDLAGSDVVAAVPFRSGFLDRLANGLDDLGLPP